MANTTIPATLIGTNRPLNIAGQGAVPYFPGFNLQFAAASTGTLFSISPTILIWNLNAGAGWNFFAGLAGPAIAFNFTASGAYNSGNIALNIQNDEIQGGILFGVTAGLSIGIQISQASLHWVKDGWHSHFETTWNTKVNLNASIQFDLVSIVLGLVVAMLDEAGKKDTILQSVNNFNSNLIGSYGLFDDVTNGFAGNGNLSVNPGFSLPINCANFVPPLKVINEALEALAGGLFIGPTVGFAIPATVHFDSVEAGGTRYNITSTQGGIVSGGAAGAVPLDNRLKFNLDRSPSLDFTLGVGANLTVLKLFSIGGSFAIDILGLLGIRPDLGTFDFSISNQLGASDLSGSQQAAEIILEWPA